MKKLLLIVGGFLLTASVSFSQQLGNFDVLYSHAPDNLKEKMIESRQNKIQFSMNKNNSFDTPLTIEEYSVDIAQNETLEKVYSFTYLASGQLHTRTRMDATLTNERRVTYNFNAMGDMTSVIYEDWNGASWDFNYRTIWDYYPSGMMASETYEDWNGSTWDLNNTLAFDYIGGQTAPSMVEVSSSDDGVSWEAVLRVLYTYSGANPNSMELVFYDENYLMWSTSERWNIANWGSNPFYPDFLFNQRAGEIKTTDMLVQKYDQYGMYPSEFLYQAGYDVSTGTYTFEAEISSEYNGGDRTKFIINEFNGVSFDSTSVMDMFYDACYGFKGLVERDYVSPNVWTIDWGFDFQGYTTPYSTSCQVDAYNVFENFSDAEPAGIRVKRWVITQAATLSFDEDFLNASLNIYPNPATNELNLKISGIELDNATYSILSLEGKTLINEIVSTNETLVDVNEIPAGIYFIQLNINGQLATKKFIKE